MIPKIIHSKISVISEKGRRFLFKWYARVANSTMKEHLSNSSRVYQLGLTIFFAGCIISFVHPDSNGFARSGSLVVTFAIYLVSINFWFDRAIEEANNIKSDRIAFIRAQTDISGYENDITNPDKKLPSFPPLTPEQEKEIYDHNRSYVNRYTNIDSELKKLWKARGQLMLAEFILGSLGTIVWGLGDLVL